MPDNKKLKNDGEGSFFGNLLRGVVKTGKNVGVPFLDIISGGKVSDIVKAITGNTELSQDDKDMLIAEMQKDVEMEQEITKRWESDNKQEHWLPKLIRPLVLANYTLLIDYVIINDMQGKSLQQMVLPLLLTLATTVTGGYFALREYGKTKK